MLRRPFVAAAAMALLVGLWPIAFIALASPADAETLKVGGTGSVTELLRQLAPGFKEDTGISLDVIAGMGSSSAISAAADGKIGLAFSGRSLRDKETSKGLGVALTFRTPFGLVTSRPGPEDVKSKELAALYRSDNPRWPDGTPILINLRPADDSDSILLGQLFPGMAEALDHLRNRKDLTVAPTDQDNADLAEKVKGSLTSASLSQVITEKRDLRFVAIDGVEASTANYLNGSYPYGRLIYVVAPTVADRTVNAFLAYLAKPAAAEILQRSGMIPVK
ncbi:hypothetical protein BH11PSE3_BH11PSE3_40390 [soil metagenome]